MRLLTRLRFWRCRLLHRKHHEFNRELNRLYKLSRWTTKPVLHYCRRCNWGW